jgi:WD40 repeat protein
VQIAFHPGDRLLACATDEPAILLCDLPGGQVRTTIPAPAKSLRFSADGSRLEAIDGGGHGLAWQLENAAGFREWAGPPQPETDGAVFDFALSPDGRMLLSTSTAGVRIWSVADERQTGFHATENQRIDAPTNAWWLGTRADEILVQVPGGLERVAIDPEGRPGDPRRVARPPGTTVIDVSPDGAWLVTSIDPEAPPCEAWPGGNPDRAHPVPLPVREKNAAISRDLRRRATQLDGDVIKFSSSIEGASWRLTPPERIGVHACVFSLDGKRIFVLGREHRIFVWDLGMLRAELERMKF